MNSLKQSLAIFSLVTLCVSLRAQTTEGVSIKSSLAPPHPSAMLDVDNSSKGILIPRVPLVNITSASPVTSPATGLLVYNTTPVSTGLPDGEGFYFWDGAKWQKLAAVGGTSGYWSAGTGNDIYRGTVNSALTDGSTLVGTNTLPSGSKSEFFVHGPSTFFAGGVPLGTPETITSTSGIQVGAPYSTIDGGHWNEINCPDFYLDMQFNTGQDVHIGAGKGSDLWVFNGSDKPGDIHASGTVYANGGAYYLSDSTKKKNISPCTNTLTKLNNCNTYRYNYKTEENNHKKHMGVIAQEIEIQFPELVVEHTEVIKEGNKFSTSVTQTKTTKGVDYAGLTAVLLQALKEQQEQIEALKARVTALENK